MTPTAQIELPLAKSHGGARPGAGRPRLARRKSVPHRKRPPHKKRHPVHITLRVAHGLPSLREELVRNMLCRVLNKQRTRKYEPGFQVMHFSVQQNHVHLIVEADDDMLRTGVSGFEISFARRLNKLLERKGAVWADRYHRRDLETPREVHNVLGYVFNNYRKHGVMVHGLPPELGFADYYSSAPRFTSWTVPIVRLEDTEPWPDVRPRTWLLAKGWSQHGPIDPNRTPGASAS